MFGRLRLLLLASFFVAAIPPTFVASAHAELTVQQIVDDALGTGCVDASSDDGYETFPAGTYRFIRLAQLSDGDYGLGWQPVGDGKAYNVIMGVGVTSATVTIPVTFQLSLSYGWSSRLVDNYDGYDHFRAFDMCGATGSIVGAFEDVAYGGDADHNDYVFSMEPATKQVVSFNYTNKIPTNVILGPGAARSLRGTFVPVGGPSLLSGEDLHIEVIGNPAGCLDQPTVTVNGFDFEIVWQDPCWEFGQTLAICLRTDKGPLEVETAALLDAKGDSISKPKPSEGDPIPLCGSETVIDCSGAFAGRSILWPPNHGMVPVFISGVTTTGDDPVTITVTGITQDEPLNGTGDGDTCPDGMIEEGLAYVRAERAGGGNGRVYVVSFTASDGDASCDGSVRVFVPHDRKVAAVDDGQTTNSMGECFTPGGRGIAGMKPTAGLDVGVTDRTVNVQYSVPAAGNVSLGLYDVTGRRVATITEGERGTGEHQTSWNVGHLSPGVYFCRLRVGSETATRTVLIRR